MPVKVSREDKGHEEFTLPDSEQVDGDTAMVGGDKSTTIQVTTDKGTPPANLPSESEDWDVTPEQRRTRAGRRGEDERPGFDPDLLPDEQEQQRQLSRRQRRNMRRREAMTGANQQIAELQAQMGQLAEYIGKLTQGQAGIATQTLDGQISSLEQARKMATTEIASAMATNEPAKLQEVMDLRDQITERLSEMKAQRSRLQASMPDPTRVPPPDQRQQQVDPRVIGAVQEHFEDFQDDYPWFDPTSGDANCNIVRAIDGELAAQGYQRHTPVFWDMMRKRMGDYGLESEQDDPEDRTPARRSPANGRREVLGRDIPAARRGGPPMNSGRSTRPNGAGAFQLSDVQRTMLQEEGLLEPNLGEADVAKRDRILSSWRKGARTLRGVN